jgi:hypothetical protein
LRPSVTILMLLAIGASSARADELAADVVAISDEAIYLDVHGRTSRGPQHGWLMISRTEPNVRRFWRELPKELGHADCDLAMNQFSKVLEQQNVGGVQLDARQCGRNDKPWTAAYQPMVDGKPAPTIRYLTSASLERLRANRYGTAYGAFAGTKWQAHSTGKFISLMRDGQSFASLPTGLSPTPATGWVIVSPSGGMAVAFDADFGGFQLWVRAGGRWKSVALVNALDPT